MRPASASASRRTPTGNRAPDRRPGSASHREHRRRRRPSADRACGIRTLRAPARDPAPTRARARPPHAPRRKAYIASIRYATLVFPEEAPMRAVVLAVIVAGGCGGESSNPQQDGQPADSTPTVDTPAASNFSFFITSSGGPSGGDFRSSPADTDGLAAADLICQMKAAAANPGAGAKQWRAYLSTAAINARDRIGTGPWFNRNGVMIAASIAALHDPAMNQISKQTGLDETGAMVPGRGDTPN